MNPSEDVQLQIRLSPRCVRWRKESLDTWLVAKEGGFDMDTKDIRKGNAPGGETGGAQNRQFKDFKKNSTTTEKVKGFLISFTVTTFAFPIMFILAPAILITAALIAWEVKQ